MEKMMKTLAMSIFFMAFISTSFGMGEWVTATKIGEGSPYYIQGNVFMECKYTVEGKLNFTVTVSQLYCPFTVEYNILSKKVKL